MLVPVAHPVSRDIGKANTNTIGHQNGWHTVDEVAAHIGVNGYVKMDSSLADHAIREMVRRSRVSAGRTRAYLPRSQKMAASAMQ